MVFPGRPGGYGGSGGTYPPALPKHPLPGIAPVNGAAYIRGNGTPTLNSTITEEIRSVGAVYQFWHVNPERPAGRADHDEPRHVPGGPAPVVDLLCQTRRDLSPSRRSRLGLLVDHDFRRLFYADIGSQLGTHMLRLALPLAAILALDATELQVGILAACATAAMAVVGLPAGRSWIGSAVATS